MAETAPGGEGQQTAVALAEAGISTTLIADAAVFAMMARVNKVIVGAHGVMANGGLVASAGCHLLALAAQHASVPLVACAGLYKLTPLFPSGHGLSYTTFELKWSPVPPPEAHDHQRQLQRAVLHSWPIGSRAPSGVGSTMYNVTVTNTGRVAGDEVVLAFVKPLRSSLRTLPRGTPVELKRLFDWRRVNLAPGASATLSFSVSMDTLAMVERGGDKALHTGDFDIVFSRGHGRELTAGLRLETAGGSAHILRSFRKWW